MGGIGSGRTPVHGLTKTIEYRTWKAIKQRCYDQNFFAYADYGGRGICLADEWINDPVAFCNYVIGTLGPRPPNYTIDRIDNDKGYVPGNMRWASRLIQSNNQRTTKKSRPGRPRKGETKCSASYLERKQKTQ